MIIFIVAALITMVFVDEYRTVVLSTGAAALAVVAVGLLRHGRGGALHGARPAAGAGGRRPWPVVLQPGPGWPIASVFSRWNNPYAHLFY